MFCVYILRSIKDADKIYAGITTNIENRLKAHNSGKSIYTNKFKPWGVETYLCFSNKDKAIAFEKYLKTPSGRAFRNKRLTNPQPPKEKGK